MGAATGPLGLIRRRETHAQPYFDSIDGSALYPAFHVIAGLARGRGRKLIEAQASPAGRVAALAWRERDRLVLWLANLTADPVKARIRGLGESARRLSVIDAASFERAVRSTDALDALARPFTGQELTLDAYVAARID